MTAARKAAPPAKAAPSSGEVHRVNFRAPARRRQVAQNRIAELKRLALFHAKHGVFRDVDAWAWAFAQTRASATTGTVVRIVAVGEFNTLVHRWRFRGDDELRSAVAGDMTDVGLGFDGAILERACETVERENEARQSAALVAGDVLARLFSVMLSERNELDLHSIGALDRPKAARLAHARQTKRDKNRRSMQEGRLARFPDRKPRTVYEATSNETIKPWLKEGISRRTWYRRRSSVSDTDAVAQVGGDGVLKGHSTPATHLCQAHVKARDATRLTAGRAAERAPAPTIEAASPSPQRPSSKRGDRRRPPTSSPRQVFDRGQLDLFPPPQLSAARVAAARIEGVAP